jgi:hypothetical protein
LRGERCFARVEALTAQIRRDVQRTRRLLTGDRRALHALPFFA